ncbi:MAG: M20/M25/M40 family metallo-hydrolase [Deltaproteobacteria bacterium]|nr:M20/M25/M40 family metallo-hydrolase [Deltaproteobacteria bacterium]
MQPTMHFLVWWTIVSCAAAACGGGNDAADRGADNAPADADGATDAPPETPLDTVEETPLDAPEDEVADVPADDGDEADAPPVVGPCGAGSPEALMGCVEQPRYLADLNSVAGAREPGSAHWQEVQDLCNSRFTALGFTVELHDYGTGVNVVGVLPGDDLAGERVLVSAHYDGVPDCPAADDNASGVAGLLETARVLSTASFRRTLVVACWDEEEDGLIGSEAYAARAAAAGENLAVNFVYEMIGFYSDTPGSQTIPSGLNLLFPEQTAALAANENRGDFLAVVADDLARPFHERMSLYGPAVGLSIVVLEVPAVLKNSPLLSDLRRSDHAGFWELDLPAMMLTDTSEFRNPHYHCGDGDDTIDTLNHDFAVKIVQTTVGAAAASLELR